MMQCSRCSHVIFDHFKRHCKKHNKLKYMPIADEYNRYGNLPPSDPFFGDYYSEKTTGITVRTPREKCVNKIESTKNYLLRLIIVDKVIIPFKWWLLAAHAVYDYELRESKQIKKPYGVMSHDQRDTLENIFSGNESLGPLYGMHALDLNFEPIVLLAENLLPSQ